MLQHWHSRWMCLRTWSKSPSGTASRLNRRSESSLPQQCVSAWQYTRRDAPCPWLKYYSPQLLWTACTLYPRIRSVAAFRCAASAGTHGSSGDFRARSDRCTAWRGLSGLILGMGCWLLGVPDHDRELILWVQNIPRRRGRGICQILRPGSRWSVAWQTNAVKKRVFCFCFWMTDVSIMRVGEIKAVRVLFKMHEHRTFSPHFWHGTYIYTLLKKRQPLWKWEYYTCTHSHTHTPA